MISTFEYLAHLAANPHPDDAWRERIPRERISSDRYAQSPAERALTRSFDASYEAAISVENAGPPSSRRETWPPARRWPGSRSARSREIFDDGCAIAAATSA